MTVRFDLATAIARARSRLGEDRYRLWSNNCEHFIEWSLNGVNRSAQVEAHRQRLLVPFSWLRPLAALRARCSRCAPHVRAPRSRSRQGRGTSRGRRHLVFRT